MKTLRTFRKYTPADFVSVVKATPRWTNGGHLVAEMWEGDIAFAVCEGSPEDEFNQSIVILNCMSVCFWLEPFGAPIIRIEISDSELEELKELEELMWKDLNKELEAL